MPTNRPAIAIDPSIMSGTPCLAGTRIPIYMISDMVWHHDVEEAMNMWGLTRADVLVACWYAGAYGVVNLWTETDDTLNRAVSSAYSDTLVDQMWLDRWRTWAQASAAHLWNGHYDKVTDPPSDGQSNLP